MLLTKSIIEIYSGEKFNNVAEFKKDKNKNRDVFEI